MKKTTTILLTLLLGVSLCISQQSNTNTTKFIIAGEQSDKPLISKVDRLPDSYISPTYTYRANANRTMTLINFDNIDAPDFFINTNPCQNEYNGYSIDFEGPSINDGGAILNEGSSFGVTGYSPPNFLAFNTGSMMANGGVPQGPETIYFYETVSYVEMLAGSANAGLIEMTAYDINNNLIGHKQITGSNALQIINIAAENISKVVIQFTGTWLVLDDLFFDTYLIPQNLTLTNTPVIGEVDLDWNYAPMNGFYENFEDEVAQNWEYVSGYWAVYNNMFNVASSDKNVSSAFYNYNFGDFDMEVKMSKDAGADCNTGIYFHGDPADLSSAGGWLYGYHLIYCTNGQWNLVRYDNGSATFIQGWIASPDIYLGLGAFNTIRIVRAAGNIDVYFNGILQGTYFDNTYNSGKLGLKMYDSGLIGNGLYDYVQVYPIVKDYTFGKVNQEPQLIQCEPESNYSNCVSCDPGEINMIASQTPPVSPYVYEGTAIFSNFNVYRNNILVDAPSITNLTNTIPGYGFYGYNVTAQYTDGESIGSEYAITWWQNDPIFEQNTYLPNALGWSAYTSDDYTDYEVLDNFHVTEFITGISFLGLTLEWMPGWTPCPTEDPMLFTVSFYTDNAGMPGTLLTSFTETLYRTETELVYSGYPMYEYNYDFPDYVDLQIGWVSVSGGSLSTPDCWYLWSNSDQGDGIAYQYEAVGGVYNPLSDDLAFILKGGWSPPAPANLDAILDNLSGNVSLQWQFTPESGKAFIHFKVYKDGTYIGISSTNNYTDPLTAFGTYSYYVTALYDEGESVPSNNADVTWQAISPANLVANLNTSNGQVNLTWSHSAKANRAFQFFNIYRNASIIATTPSLNYTDNLSVYGTYDYYVTAQYAEGESGPSNNELINWMGINELGGYEVLIYPNPADEKLIIETGAEIESIIIFNLFGQEALNTTPSGNKITINTSSLPEGIYFIKLITDKDEMLRKIVIK